jgi:hypothetical protein
MTRQMRAYSSSSGKGIVSSMVTMAVNASLIEKANNDKI